MRMVDSADWDLSGMRDRSRAAKLMNPLSSEDLISAVAVEAEAAALEGRSSWRWQLGQEMVGCGRAIALFPLSHETFDALFNGRSGYRAQYHLSCEEGIQFNTMLICALLGSLGTACARSPHRQRESLKRSFEGPDTKLWVLYDGEPFRCAAEGELSPRRWLRNNPASMGLRAPMPSLPAIEIKGTWISDLDGE